MTHEDLLQTAERLEARILRESGAARLAMRPEFSRVMDHLQRGGVSVPGRFRRLQATLCDEAVEEMFDNMPV